MSEGAATTRCPCTSAAWPSSARGAGVQGEHPAVAASSLGLAMVYQRMGKYDDALPPNQRNLAIREKVHGGISRT
eukprot:3933675-Pyramimonas_sp.AAC.1